MTKAEFTKRWRTLDYNRLIDQGVYIDPPNELQDARPRITYGRNGRGRHAAFLFSSPYLVRTWRDGIETVFKVSQGREQPIEVALESETDRVGGHGVEIFGVDVVPSILDPADVRALLSTRFLIDPSFVVSVDGITVAFSDVPSDCLNEIEVDVSDHGVAKIFVIDSGRADRTTKQHGIAWWVNGRLVGNAGSSGFQERFIDGRTEEAKRYTFIIHANFLDSSVLPDWSGFKEINDAWGAAQEVIYDQIREIISGLLRERRSETLRSVRATHQKAVKALPMVSQDRWNMMLDELVERCPTLGEGQLDQVMGILANLELSQSQYSLLDKLHEFSPGDFDSWNELLQEWTIKSAKAALDEIAERLKLIEEIRIKTSDDNTDEVQELQPLFEKALWIFGPQFESIEFTSNVGMTKVIRKLFDPQGKGSRNRPDFVISLDSSIGFYSRPAFDDQFNETGTDVLVIVELKRPGVPLTDVEKGQVWKYIKELKANGHVTENTSVYGYVLGDSIEPTETDERKEGDRIFIRPMLYSAFIGQAEKRMMNLHRRLAEAPFMKEIIESAEATQQDTQEGLFDEQAG